MLLIWGGGGTKSQASEATPVPKHPLHFKEVIVNPAWGKEFLCLSFF